MNLLLIDLLLNGEIIRCNTKEEEQSFLKTINNYDCTFINKHFNHELSEFIYTYITKPIEEAYAKYSNHINYPVFYYKRGDTIEAREEKYISHKFPNIEYTDFNYIIDSMQADNIMLPNIADMI